MELFIPYFAHQRHGGKRARVVKQTNTRVYLELIDSEEKKEEKGSKKQKQIYVNTTFIKHVLDNDMRRIQLGDWVGDFTVTKELGKGTYGSVSSVVRSSDQKTYALKTILDPNSKGITAPLMEECDIFQSLRHPNLVRPLEIQCRYDRSTKGLYVYFLMEEMTTSVRGLQKRYGNRPLPRQLCEYITVGMLQGIHHMNQQGYSHSDLSPNNVLVKLSTTDDGHEVIERVCLTDYSLSRSLNGRLLPTRIVTSWYRAPELFANHRSYTLSINMWSIGMITLECICGHPIFWKTDEVHTVERIMDLCGIPSPKWTQRFGKLSTVSRPIYGNETTTPIERIQHALSPRPIRSNNQDVDVYLTDEYKVLINFALKALQFDPRNRVSTRDALRRCFGQQIIEGDSKQVTVPSPDQSSVSISHFRVMCDQMMYPFRNRTCALDKKIYALAYNMFTMTQTELRYNQWSLLMVGCCSLACKHIVYKNICATLQPQVDTVLQRIGQTGQEYTMEDVYDAECYIINQGGLYAIKL